MQVRIHMISRPETTTWITQGVAPCGNRTRYTVPSHRANPSGQPRWSSGRKCDCRTRGLGFDFWVGQSIAGLFSVFRKCLNSSTESGIVPIMCTSVYLFEDKSRDVACIYLLWVDKTVLYYLSPVPMMLKIK
ncbi:hypothetical protein SFRURICE_015995 [Spodoptera frugiperda]|nr:hypothetical protein SFRURICE_015995 [Spodoptera frugiperda]